MLSKMVQTGTVLPCVTQPYRLIIHIHSDMVIHTQVADIFSIFFKNVELLKVFQVMSNRPILPGSLKQISAFWFYKDINR